jgi:hypothetical protein
MRWIAAWVVMVSLPAFAERISPQDGRLVRASARTRASLSPDGAWLAKHARDGDSLEVYKDGEGRLQILEEVDGAYLVLHVERLTLRTVTLDDAELFPSAAAAEQPMVSTTPGMRLLAGAPIDSATPAARGLSKVGLRLGALQITGYVDTSKIGTLYQGGGLSWSEAADVTLPARFQLLDAPSGHAFVISANPERTPAHVIQRDAAFTLVQISAGAIGWIASRQLKPPPASGSEFIGPMIMNRVRMCGPGGRDARGIDGCAPDPENTVREGAPLFDAIDGRIVGTVISYFRHKPARTDRGWNRYDIPTRFGTLRLWTQPSDPALHPPPGEHHDAVDPNDPNDIEGGSEGALEGVVAAPPPPPPPPLPPPPRMITPPVLQANRISGVTQPTPDRGTQVEMVRAGKTRLIASFKLCVDEVGAVSRVVHLKSSGFPAYDDEIVKAISKWVFRPFLVDGAVQPVCSVVTFIFDVQNASDAEHPTPRAK